MAVLYAGADGDLKDGRTAVHNAVGKLIDMGYLLRTKLLPNESVNNCFEYVYSFFDVPISKEEADELEAETRRKAITVREGGRAKRSVSATGEKQEVENLYLDPLPSEPLLAENHGQSNTKNKIPNNQLLSDKSSISPSPARQQVFNNQTVEMSDERMAERYNADEYEYYTEVVKESIDYWNLGDWLTVDGRDGYKEADNIVGFIVDEICSPLPYTTLRGMAFPECNKSKRQPTTANRPNPTKPLYKAK